MHDIDGNVSVVQKTNKEHIQMAKVLSEPTFFKHRSNVSSETTEEETLCSPDSQYCMLNDIEGIHEQRPVEVNISYKSDLLESSQEHCVFEKELYHVLPPVIPKLSFHGMNKESIHSQRMRIIWKKMDAAFDGIVNLYDKIPEPDGSQDLLRRCKRAAEFSSRLSRNYLYQLRQQVCELKKQIREYVSLSRVWHTLHQSVCQNLVVAHHSALQGLQAYLHHMPTSVQCAASDKLKELLCYIIELSTLCNRAGVVTAVSTSKPGSDHIEKKCKALLQLINSKHSINESDLPASHDVAVSVMTTTGQREWESSLREPEQTRVSVISGGCSVSKIISWKESATKLARAVYGSPAKKCSSAIFRRHHTRFPISKVNTEDKPSPSVKCESELKMPCESSSAMDMRHPPNKLLEICEEEFQKKLGSVLRNLIDNLKAERDQENVKQSDGQSSAFVDDMQSLSYQVKNTASQPLQQSKSDNSLHTTHAKDERRVTKIGPHNAQLIYLPPDDTISHDALLGPSANKESKITLIPGNCDTGVQNGNSKHKSRSPMQKTSYHTSKGCFKLKQNVTLNSVNICHQPRSKDSPELDHSMESFRKASTATKNMKVCVGRNQRGSRVQSPLLSLPKKDILSAMDYHQKFHCYLKSNPMYKGTAPPWITIGRLSDHIVEQVLQEVVGEMKLESLVKNIYTLELQE
ncbi:uncharacterized protein LOC111864327 isoform X3 [Cryptotermes secundus]|nr:uncharacterized protein LOC111864327 isoform X3 [Cryptotermes secundus]XP_033607280.1 uncharacterized protein LOC111864327 isoform X3 [Cryptotermes secundus]